MNISGKYSRSKLLIGLVSLLSASFFASAPFESNPQSCGMISVIQKKKKEPGDEDFWPIK